MLSAVLESAVDTVLYGLRAPADSVTPPESADNQMPRIVVGLQANASRALFEAWLARPGRKRAQEPFVKALLTT